MTERTRRSALRRAGALAVGLVLAGCTASESATDATSDRTRGAEPMETTEKPVTMVPMGIGSPAVSAETTDGSGTEMPTTGVGGVVCDPKRFEKSRPTAGEIRIEVSQGTTRGDLTSRERVSITNISNESLDFSGYVVEFDGERRHQITDGTLVEPDAELLVFPSGGGTPGGAVLTSCPAIYVQYTGFDGSTIGKSGTIRILRPSGAVVVEKSYTTDA